MTYLSRGNMIINMKLPDIPVVRCLRQIGWSWYICLQKKPLNIYILIYVLRFVSVCVGLTFFSVTVITFGSVALCSHYIVNSSPQQTHTHTRTHCPHIMSSYVSTQESVGWFVVICPSGSLCDLESSFNNLFFSSFFLFAFLFLFFPSFSYDFFFPTLPTFDLTICPNVVSHFILHHFINLSFDFSSFSSLFWIIFLNSILLI